MFIYMLYRETSSDTVDTLMQRQKTLGDIYRGGAGRRRAYPKQNKPTPFITTEQTGASMRQNQRLCNENPAREQLSLRDIRKISTTLK